MIDHHGIDKILDGWRAVTDRLDELESRLSDHVHNLYIAERERQLAEAMPQIPEGWELLSIGLTDTRQYAAVLNFEDRLSEVMGFGVEWHDALRDACERAKGGEG